MVTIDCLMHYWIQINSIASLTTNSYIHKIESALQLKRRHKEDFSKAWPYGVNSDPPFLVQGQSHKQRCRLQYVDNHWIHSNGKQTLTFTEVSSASNFLNWNGCVKMSSRVKMSSMAHNLDKYCLFWLSQQALYNDALHFSIWDRITTVNIWIKSFF
jgi:hypothetical protein